MTVPFQPPQFDAVGFTKAAMARGHSLDKIAQILEQNGHGQYAKELRDSQQDNAKNLITQGAEGVMQGFGRPMAAAGGALVQKLSGDDRSIADIYRQLKDDADIRSGAYQKQNPTKALSAQIVGSAIAGKVNPFQIAAFGNATRTARAANSALNAGVAGVAGSLANTNEDLTDWDGIVPGEGVRNALLDAGIVGGFSAVAGGALSPIVEGVSALGRSGATKLSDALEARARRLAGPSTAPATAVAAPGATPGTAVALPTRSTLDRVRDAGKSVVTRAAQTVRPAINPEGGEARILNRAQATGQSMDDLTARSAAADPEDLLGEVMGEKGIRDITTSRIIGNKAPDQVKSVLTTRARNETPNLITKVERELGPQVDEVAYANQRLTEARSAAKEPYERFEAYGFLRTKDVKNALVGVNRTIRTLRLGTGIFDEMSAVAQLEGDKLPKNLFDKDTGLLKKALTARQVNYLKQALDQIIYSSEPAVINGVQQPSKFSDTQRRLLEKARNQLVDAADRATEYVDDAGQRVSAYKTARDAWAGPVQERNALLAGQKLGRTTIQPVDVPRVLDTPQKAQVARGVGNAILDDLNKVKSGTRINDPSPVLTGSRTADTRTLVAAGGDTEKARRIQAAAEGAGRRIGTYQRVMGGSETVERASDVAEQMAGPVNPFEVAGALTNPVGTASSLFGKLSSGIGRRMFGNQMDEAAQYLLAGGDGQMTREEAIAAVKRMQPLLEDYWRRRVGMQSRVGAQAAREFTGKR